MPNPLFNMLTGRTNQPNVQASMPGPQNMQDAMGQLRSNPAQMIRNAGYNVPDEIIGNPQATVMHLIQTGQVSSPMMQRIQPMMNMLMGKR